MRTIAAALLAALVACGGSDAKTRKPGACDGPCPVSKIDHVIVVVQENHTFDNYFGTYCTAPTGTAPTCTSGPACCEAGPGSDPTGALPIVLDDAANAAYDPNHTQGCELPEADSGAMDKYVSGVNGCSDPRNFAYAGAAAQPYRDLAGSGALADRYFQPVSGQSSSNDMYLATAQFEFLDDTDKPEGVGTACSLNDHAVSLTGTTLGDVLDGSGVSWAFYAEGYDQVAAAKGGCGTPDAACPPQIPLYPCVFDPADIPFDYYSQFTDDPKVLRDFSQFQKDLDGLTLPQVVFVKALGFRTEHPGTGVTISDGTAFVTALEDAVAASQYAPDTLVLVTWDEGGGYFDHVAPPGLGSDGQPYGTRIPLLANGPFVAPGTISHTQMEHSSIVTFVEWNWTNMQTGQLGGRDGKVANLGSMLDSTTTGVTVPP
jgi:phospholipase C|nr:alkaline phosphatase family protein [Kofleriaceae bacterium]